MAEFSTLTWAVMAAVGGLAAIGVLGAFAAHRQREIAAHELRVEAARVRREYLERLKPIEVGFADDDEAARVAA